LQYLFIIIHIFIIVIIIIIIIIIIYINSVVYFLLIKVGSDRHGSLFILDDLIFSENAQSLSSIPTGTMNVRFAKNGNSNLPLNNNSALQGSSLNSLLRSLFLVSSYRNNINSIESIQKKEHYQFLTSLLLPGGIDCWEILMESTLITITSFSTIQVFYYIII
jgi:hypothetical protein